MINLILGNSVEKLKELPSESVDMILTSPPYDKLRHYNHTLEWNFEVFKEIARELSRILKKNGTIVWIVGDSTKNGTESGTSFKQVLYFKEVLKLNLHDTMIYAKNNPIPLTHRRYEQQFEFMFVLSKGRIKTFNPIMRDTKNPNGTNGGSIRVHGEHLEKKNKPGRINKQQIQYNIWYYSVGYPHSSKNKIAFKHPAVFPEKLAEDHISTWTNKGDTVLDPFMGSGTTAVACKKLERDFIGIELVEEYYEIAKERTKEK